MWYCPHVYSLHHIVQGVQCLIHCSSAMLRSYTEPSIYKCFHYCIIGYMQTVNTKLKGKWKIIYMMISDRCTFQYIRISLAIRVWVFNLTPFIPQSLVVFMFFGDFKLWSITYMSWIRLQILVQHICLTWYLACHIQAYIFWLFK